MFRFKRFSVCQQGCAMKVGTDGVLLGAWCALEASQRRVLDIGTGTGVIALMAAQRSAEARITAVDIDGECARRAAGNFAASPWGDRLEAVQADIRDFAPGHTFDHIITNPPYFSSSLLPPDSGRRLARHCVALPFADLAAAFDRLLAPCGRVSMILPADAADAFVGICRGTLSLSRRCDVRTTPRSAVRRSMLEFGRGYCAQPRHELLVIQTAPETFTEEYRTLTRDFYLKF